MSEKFNPQTENSDSHAGKNPCAPAASVNKSAITHIGIDATEERPMGTEHRKLVCYALKRAFPIDVIYVFGGPASKAGLE